jgi:hypothetical protein
MQADDFLFISRDSEKTAVRELPVNFQHAGVYLLETPISEK